MKGLIFVEEIYSSINALVKLFLLITTWSIAWELNWQGGDEIDEWLVINGILKVLVVKVEVP